MVPNILKEKEERKQNHRQFGATCNKLDGSLEGSCLLSVCILLLYQTRSTITY